MVTSSLGIVIGPSGSGKTSLIRKICRSKPEGMLYVEVFAPRRLAQNLNCWDDGPETNIARRFVLYVPERGQLCAIPPNFDR